MNETAITDKQAADEMKDMYLNFNVSNEIYSVDIRYVLQIVGMQEIREMPEMAHYMKGYINLRGSVVPVVSLRLRFGIIETDFTNRTCIIVVQVGEREIGLIVDAIEETLTVEPEDISPQPVTGEAEANPYITGIAKLKNNQTSVIINLQQLFLNHTLLGSC